MALDISGSQWTSISVTHWSKGPTPNRTVPLNRLAQTVCCGSLLYVHTHLITCRGGARLPSPGTETQWKGNQTIVQRRSKEYKDPDIETIGEPEAGRLSSCDDWGDEIDRIAARNHMPRTGAHAAHPLLHNTPPTPNRAAHIGKAEKREHLENDPGL
ncbi:hypothetical protein K438DRAFT_1776663 [Mycena galopus ATCC 62051]|nr:hypothetical protein K438DRAFT_1776663 [Mycena galopus ATCC 62051]